MISFLFVEKVGRRIASGQHGQTPEACEPDNRRDDSNLEGRKAVQRLESGFGSSSVDQSRFHCLAAGGRSRFFDLA